MTGFVLYYLFVVILTALTGVLAADWKKIGRFIRYAVTAIFLFCLMTLILDELVLIASVSPLPTDLSDYVRCAAKSSERMLCAWPMYLAATAGFCMGAVLCFLRKKLPENCVNRRTASAAGDGVSREPFRVMIWLLVWALLLILVSTRDDLWSFIWERESSFITGALRLVSDAAVAAGVTGALAFICWGRHRMEGHGRKQGQYGAARLQGWPLALAVFTAHVLIAACVILPFYIADGGCMMIAADWDAEQIPYSVLMNQSVKSGEVLWNWKIDIGSDFVSSFSFYNLASPFVLFSFLFPPEWIPNLLGLLLILKMAAAGLTSFWWLKRETGKRTAFVGSILYAFSGYQACNLVFNHFADVVAVFPLLMLGLDELVQEKKKGRFLAAVSLNAFTNWYFFIGEVIFLILYYIVRYGFCRQPQDMAETVPQKAESSGTGKSNPSDSALHRIAEELRDCLIEGCLGVGITGFILLPSILSVMNNPRTGEKLPLSAAFHFDLANYMLILRGIFLPSESMYELSFQKGGDWHLGPAYLPLFGGILTISYLLCSKKNGGEKRNWLKGMLGAGMACMAIPLFNNAFSLESAEPYRRYMYMFILLAALASAGVLENTGGYPWKWGIRISILAIAVICAYSMWNFRIQENADKGHIAEAAFLILMGLVGTWASSLVLKNPRSISQRALLFRTILMTSAFAVCSTAVTTELYRVNYSLIWSTRAVKTELDVMADNLDDALPYRYSFQNNYYNYSMMHNVSGATSFISTVSPSIFEFYEAIGNPRHTWTPDLDYASEALLANRYFVHSEQIGKDASDVKENPEEKRLTLLKEYQNGNYVMGLYENPCWVPFSCAYDSYITRSELERMDSALRPAVMLGNLVVKDEDEMQVKGLLKHADSEEIRKELERSITEAESESSNPSLSEAELNILTESGENSILHSYVEARRSAGMDDSSFRYSTKGFELDLASDRDTWAFISVPYDSQWTAEVNGEKAEILDICGLMAVRVGRGTNHIVFRYTAGNLKAGAAVTAVCAALTALYCRACVRKKKAGEPALCAPQ